MAGRSESPVVAQRHRYGGHIGYTAKHCMGDIPPHRGEVLHGQTAPPDLSQLHVAIYGESRSKVSFVAKFTAEWNHEEHCAEEPFKYALAARPVCVLTLAPRATVTFVHMHSIANFPERRSDQATLGMLQPNDWRKGGAGSFLQKLRLTRAGLFGGCY